MGNYFRPDQEVTRAEALKILLLAFDILLFPNFQLLLFRIFFPQDWHFPLICTAYTRGIVGGNPDGTFRPNRSVNRAEMCK